MVYSMYISLIFSSDSEIIAVKILPNPIDFLHGDFDESVQLRPPLNVSGNCLCSSLSLFFWVSLFLSKRKLVV